MKFLYNQELFVLLKVWYK